MNLLESLKMRWVVWVWNHTPNCAEMSSLASQALDRELPLGLRLKMRLHYLVCCWCKRYSKHLHFLSQAAPRLNEWFGELPSRGLSAAARQRIFQQMQNVRAEEAGNFL
jgi:hypothetical protein